MSPVHGALAHQSPQRHSLPSPQRRSLCRRYLNSLRPRPVQPQWTSQGPQGGGFDTQNRTASTIIYHLNLSVLEETVSAMLEMSDLDGWALSETAPNRERATQ